MEYIVVITYNLDEFINRVNDKIKEGYICQGGIFKSDTNYFIQAMIKIQKTHNDTRPHINF